LSPGDKKIEREKKLLKYFFVIIVSKITWLLPYPTPSRLIRIGNPIEDSPVLVTCNFALTVEKLKRVLKGRDLYLLVANTKGINVWCGACIVQCPVDALCFTSDDGKEITPAITRKYKLNLMGKRKVSGAGLD
jgi:ferredoxin